MCLNANKIKRKGVYKESSYKANKDDSYKVETWGKCGTCQECMAEKANNWLVRNYYEEKAHTKKCFITLTYAKNPRILIKKDLQDFIKRLRFKLYKAEQIKIRYFGCGEYGTLNNRPHFHLIIYGWKDEKPIYKGLNKKGNVIYESELIRTTWGKGLTSYQNFNSKEIPYIALYNSPNDTGRKRVYAKKAEILKHYKNKTLASETVEKRLNKIKSEYAEVKEFNVWSQGIGWTEFLKQYNTSKLTFEEYIEDGVYLTPSPWVKVMANMGEVTAIEEMLKRAKFEIDREQTTPQRQAEKNAKVQRQHSKEVLQWQKDKEKTIM